jgi:hypothetical protein
MTIPGWDDAWQVLFDGLGRMKGVWPSRDWSWDERFNCCSSAFASEQEAAARTATALALPTEWTAATIGGAPQPLRDIVEQSGGVRAGQRVLSHGPLAGLTAFGLWWPWGNKKTISLRIGLADVEPQREPFLKFRTLFGVTP